jgi:hypothetical protein
MYRTFQGSLRSYVYSGEYSGAIMTNYFSNRAKCKTGQSRGGSSLHAAVPRRRSPFVEIWQNKIGTASDHALCTSMGTIFCNKGSIMRRIAFISSLLLGVWTRKTPAFLPEPLYTTPRTQTPRTQRCLDQKNSCLSARAVGAEKLLPFCPCRLYTTKRTQNPF